MAHPPFENLLQFYNRELFGNILPFWMKNGIDLQHGGFFTCFSNDGGRLLHRHKFTWSQGRFLWVLSRLYRSLEGRAGESERKRYLEPAAAGAEFLTGHARLDNGNCAFILDERGGPVLLDRDGKARGAAPGEGYDLSVYADFFVIYGLGEYARASGDRRSLDFALELYEHTRRRLESGDYRTDPYPVPDGYKVHGLPMIRLETAQELACAAESLGLEQKAAGLRAEADECAAEIFTNFRLPQEKLILEMIGTDNRPRDTLLGRYVCPGHVIEDMWFIMHRALARQDMDLFGAAAETLKAAVELGWDQQHGGFFLFIDREGGVPPAGELPAELARHVMAVKARSDWPNKLWWVHSEALYTLLLAYSRLGRPWMLDWYWKVHEYTFATFPNPDRLVGEWIQIRDRQGKPESKVVALPVKDPFHIARALLLAIPVIEGLVYQEQKSREAAEDQGEGE
ncbi:MAG: AGE family epimerase/isomerase [Candidatus Glassbacteria bacterium]|nr:AGE family epimerase/isomerase [Candidatus Glassbacteria bacterium]